MTNARTHHQAANGGWVTFISCPAPMVAQVQEQYPGAIVHTEDDDSFYDVLELDGIENYETFEWCPICGTAPCEF